MSSTGAPAVCVESNYAHLLVNASCIAYIYVATYV